MLKQNYEDPYTSGASFFPGIPSVLQPDFMFPGIRTYIMKITL